MRRRAVSSASRLSGKWALRMAKLRSHRPYFLRMDSGSSSGHWPSQTFSAASTLCRTALGGTPLMLRYTGIRPVSCSMVGLLS